MQMNGCATEAAGRLPGEIGANRSDLSLQGIHDVALRIELQGRIELHVQHFESWHLHFHGAVGADLGRMLQLLGPHSNLAGDRGGAVPPLRQFGGLCLQGVIDGGERSLHRTCWRWVAVGPDVHTSSWSCVCLGIRWVLHCGIEGKMQRRKNGKKEEINDRLNQILQVIQAGADTV